MKKYLFKNKWKTIMALIVGALGALSVVAMAHVIQLLVDAIVSGNAEQLKFVAVVAFVYVVIDSYMDYAVEIVNEQLVQAVVSDLRQDILASISQHSIESFYQEPEEYYLNLLTNDIEVVDEDYLKEFLSMYNDVWTFIFGLVSSLVISPFFSLIMIMMSLAPIVLPKLMGDRLQSAKKEVSQAQEQYLGNIKEGLMGFLTLKIYRGFPGYRQKIQTRSQALAEAKVQNTHHQRGVYAISYGLRELVSVFSWVVGGFFVIAGQLDFATFFAVKQLVAYVAYPIQGFSASYTGLVAARFNCQKILDFIEQSADEVSEVSEQAPLKSLTLSDVSLVKENRIILDHINLTFERGKKYLLMGESGSGKTSLLRLLLGYYPPTSGQLAWQYGAQTPSNSTLDLDSVGVVQQDTMIFREDLADNVTLFKDSQVELAPLMAQVGLQKWSEHHEGTLDDQVLNSQKISGGEKRRLDIARALYHNRDVLLFDEPVAGLDEKNRRTIEETILSLDDKLIIYITHQISEDKIAAFDAVIKLKDGKIVSTQTQID